MDGPGGEHINKILIADDDKQTLAMLNQVLLHFGYAADSAENGDAAMEHIRAAKPDLILIDVCKLVREDPETRSIPIIVMTGFTESAIKMQCLEAGANDFITKPVDYAELNARIKNLLQFREFEAVKVKNEVLADTIRLIENVKKEWEMTLDCINDVVILVDAKQNIVRCNKALAVLTGKPYSSLHDMEWLGVLKNNGFEFVENGPCSMELRHSSGRCFSYNSYPVPDENITGPYAAVITLQDVTEAKLAEDSIRKKNQEIEKAYADLKAAESQLLQQEKMASIGQLAAGVAHEINNPMGFIISNLGALDKYAGKLRVFITAQSEAIAELTKNTDTRVQERVKEFGRSLKIDYITGDMAPLIKESLEGADRVKGIVQDLKSFSHVDEAELKMTDINAGLESTVNIVWNELKYKATVKKEYGEVPKIKCNPGQLNQVFMNMLLNAADAIEKQGEIGIKTWNDEHNIYAAVSDTGSGIPGDKVNRIFEPFYTTKEVGKGTGLGLSIAYDIVKKHKGDIAVESVIGKGTTFTIKLPLAEAAENAGP